MDLACAALGALLLTSAALKATDRTGTAVALGAYGVRGRWADLGWAVLVAVEAPLGAGVAAGSRPALLGAAALLASFAAAQGTLLALGRGGAPCGCLGARGHVGGWSLARAALGAAALAALAAADPSPPAWTVPVALAAAAVGWAALRPAEGSALDVAGEGPPIGTRLPTLVAGPGLHVALFTSEGCRLCRALDGWRPPAGVALRRYDEVADAEAWRAAAVPGSPYAVVLGGDGTVLAKGTVNAGGHLDDLLAADAAHDFALPSSRRGFLARAGAVATTLAAARTVGSLVKPGEAEAFHFCGHIYTTDSCPHPTGLPRIDSRGFPLRARDGHRVDDLGRLVDLEGRPVDEDGAPLLDAEGRPLPPASRTRVCSATGRRFGIRVRTDGAWYRCCGGHVRKLVDCCSTHPKRINGDASLRGYCYGKRRVFCVMYFQTPVPC